MPCWTAKVALIRVRINVNRCRATVIQSGDGEIGQGPQPHMNHPGQVGAGLTARITGRAKREAMADIFKPATAIVNEVLLEESTNDLCPSLPKPINLVKAANHLRQRHRPSNPLDLEFELQIEHIPDDFLRRVLKVVVIVGGGYGGVQLAVQLDSYCKVVLIDPKDAFHHNVGALRAIVEPTFIKKTLIPYEETLKHGSFVKDRVVSCNISRKTVTLAGGEEINYDYLVFACGSSVPFPGKVPLGTSMRDAETLYSECADQVAKSNRIVVIGGGAVGVELVGELASDYPNKKVTLMHNRDQILDERLSQKLIKKIQDGLKALKVETVLGERVNLDDLDFDSEKPWITGPLTLTTDQGTSVETDMVFRCTGLKVNSIAYQSKLSDKMEKNGSLKVDRYLQVEEIKDVFAIGDCNNTRVLKLAYIAGMQADVVAENIKRLTEHKSLKEYKPGNMAMVIPLGRNGGASQLPNGMVAGSFLTKTIKGKDMLTSRYWKLMKQKVPSN